MANPNNSTIDLLPTKQRTPLFACLFPCWRVSAPSTHSRRVSFADPISIENNKRKKKEEEEEEDTQEGKLNTYTCPFRDLL